MKRPGKGSALLAACIGLAALAAGCHVLEITTTRWERTAGACPSDPVPWEVAEPQQVGLASRPLEEVAALAATGELGNVHSILVVREGKLVFERYFAGRDQTWGRPLGEVAFTAETLHDLRSVTKSVVGALVGIALGEGLLPGLDAPLASLLPEHAEALAPEARGIRLRHALTMTAGLGWDALWSPYWWPWNDETEMWRSGDPVGFALSRPVEAAPGERFTYNGGLPTVLAAVVEAATGRSIEEFAAERLFCPLGVTAFEWKRHTSGIHIAASGLRLRPRDLARFGWMMLSGGTFGGRPLVPEAFVRESLRTQVRTSGSIEPGYGYQWWITELDAPDGRVEAPVALGYGGQRIFLLPRERCVVVVTAGEYGAFRQGRAGRRVAEAVLAAAARASSPRASPP